VNPNDDEAIRAVVKRWEQAWNCGDMSAAAALFCEDADFVNVRGSHWHGRAQIESEHARLHQSEMKGSIVVPLEVGVQCIGAKLALVHMRWSNIGRHNTDGTPRRPQERRMSWVLLGDGHGRWFIRSAHNTPISSAQ
jgi:uncharacterized protein (TIGR02246 family)